MESEPVSAVIELEHRLAAAWVRGDRAFIESLLASDWTVIDPSGKLLTRQHVLEEAFVSSDRTITAMTIDDLNVRAFGDVVVATGRTRATGAHRGERASVVLRFTDVFAHREGRWQVVASHGTIEAP